MHPTAGISLLISRDGELFADFSLNMLSSFLFKCCFLNRFAIMFLAWFMESGPLFLERCVCLRLILQDSIDASAEVICQFTNANLF